MADRASPSACTGATVQTPILSTGAARSAQSEPREPWGANACASTKAGLSARDPTDPVLPKVRISTPSMVRRCDRRRRLSSFAAIAGVAGVLAAGLIRDNLQAHLALARVGEQSPSSTPTLLPVRTSWGTTVRRPQSWPFHRSLRIGGSTSSAVMPRGLRGAGCALTLPVTWGLADCVALRPPRVRIALGGRPVVAQRCGAGP